MQSPLTPLLNFVFSNFSSLHPPKVSCATLLKVWPYTITIKYFPLSLFLISSILSSSTKLFIPFLFPSPAFIPSFECFTLTRLLFIKSFSTSESFSFLTAMKQVFFRFGTNLFFIISLIIIRAFIFLRFNSFTEFGLLLLEFCNFLSLPTLLLLFLLFHSLQTFSLVILLLFRFNSFTEFGLLLLEFCNFL